MGKIMLNGKQYASSDDYHIYTTTEQEVGMWIDGSLIYEKVVDLGTLPNATTKNVAHNIANLSNIISVDIVATDGSSQWLTVPYTTTNSTDAKYQIGYWMTSTNISIKSDWDRSGWTGFAILRYTKA